MREIKFRAFIENEMGGFMIPSEDSDCFMVSNGNGFTIYDEYKNTIDKDFTFMQFTNCVDKNEQEIYESDICYCNGVNYVIRLLIPSGAYTVHNVENESDQRFLMHCASQLIIVGNIHENPEILNAQNN